MKRLLITVITVLLAISVSISSAFAGDFDISEIIGTIVDFKLSELECKNVQELAEYFAEAPGTGEEWLILTLRNTRDDINYQDYREALKTYIKEHQFNNPVEKQKTVLVYLAVNGDPADISEAADETIGELGLMSYVFGLHILNNGAPCSKFTKEALISEILSFEKADGGWAVMGDYADIDTTAMTIQALAPYYPADKEVKDAVDRAVAILSDRMQDDGCYSAFGNINPESSAQVIFAMASIGIDALRDERFIKNGVTLLDGLLKFRLENGTFTHTENGAYNKTSTNQALYCLSSYLMATESKENFYVFGELTEPEYEPPVKDKEGNSTASFKTYIYIGIAAAAAIWMIVLALKKKKSFKSYMSVLIAAALAAVGVSFINIQSTDKYYEKEELPPNESITTTISIKCETIIGEADYIPENGIILDFASVKIPKNGTAYDQLIAAAKEFKIQTDSKAGYVSGIGYIYEHDFGELSGWMFRVNGKYASTSCEELVLSENDYVEWIYTKELGKDIGNYFEGE